MLRHASKTEDQPHKGKRFPQYPMPQVRIFNPTFPPAPRGLSKCRVSRVRGEVRPWCGQLALTVIRIRTLGAKARNSGVMAATLASLFCRSRHTIARSAFKKLVCATVPHNSSGRTSMIAMQRKPSVMMPHSTNLLDYPCTMSGFERESLAAEAKLKAERKKKKAAKDLATGSGSVEYPQG
jgi:hypothetical protein